MLCTAFRLGCLIASLAVWLGIDASAQGRPTTSRAVEAPARSIAPADSPLVVVTPVEWWLERNADWRSGRVYVGGTWRNATDEPLHASVTYRVFTEDGRELRGCIARANLAASERAWLVCDSGDAPERLPWRRPRLRVSARIYSVSKDERDRLPLFPEAADWDIQMRHADATQFTAWARIRIAGGTDTTASALFRLYNPEGVQLLSCESGTERFLPEIALRLENGVCGLIPRRLGNPKVVRAELLAP
jgi:hypothetical protein